MSNHSPLNLLLRAGAAAAKKEATEWLAAAREDIREATDDLLGPQEVPPKTAPPKAPQVLITLREFVEGFIAKPDGESPSVTLPPAERPLWYQRAIAAGKKDPCPICRASGARHTRSQLTDGADKRLRFIKCYHCKGSGDESAVHRRNGRET